MNSMKRVGLAVVVLILGAIVGASPAFAAKKYTESLVLVPPAIDPPEPEASGTVTYQTDYYGGYSTGEATVSCRGLTPGNEYDVHFLVGYWVPSPNSGGYAWYVCITGRHAADTKGRLTTQFSYGSDFFGSSGVVDVCVQNDQGNFVLLGRYDPSWCEYPYWY